MPTRSRPGRYLGQRPEAVLSKGNLLGLKLLEDGTSVDDHDAMTR